MIKIANNWCFLTFGSWEIWGLSNDKDVARVQAHNSTARTRSQKLTQLPGEYTIKALEDYQSHYHLIPLGTHSLMVELKSEHLRDTSTQIVTTWPTVTNGILLTSAERLNTHGLEAVLTTERKIARHRTEYSQQGR